MVPISEIYCKLNGFVMFMATVQVDWVSVLVAADRVIAVAFGLWYRQHCTAK